MKKQDLKSYLKLLFDFDAATDDIKLKPDEFIRIVAIKKEINGDTHSIPFYIQTVAELEKIIKKYKYTYNLYTTIATTKGKNSTKEYMNARKVMFLDFDKKDYPQLKELKDFIAHVKNKMPVLFNHCIVDSGNGYHFYVAIRKTLDNSRATRINKNLAKILGADLKAVSPTQLMRLPTSLNLKHESKLVNIITNNYGHEKFKLYDLTKLEKIIYYATHDEEDSGVEVLPPKEFNKVSSFYCIEKMLATGAIKGDRNFCLGRIIKYLQTIRGFTYNASLKQIQEWNQRCSPPKSVNEIKNDFDRYWKSDYKLLGCHLEDEAQQSTLNKYCEKYSCKTIYKDSDIQIKTKEIEMDNNLLKNTVLRKLRGNHYLILSVLHLHSEGLTLSGLKEQITNRNTNRCCLSPNTLKTILEDLEPKYIIKDKYGTYRLVDIKNFGLGYTRYYYSATILLINGIIKQQDYLVYLCLVRNLQSKSSNVTYDTLSDDCGIEKSNIGKHIRNLHRCKILEIEKSYNEKGIVFNSYTLVA